MEGVEVASIVTEAVAELAASQRALLATARERLAAKTMRVQSYEEMVQALAASASATAGAQQSAGAAESVEEEEGEGVVALEGAEAPAFFLAPWADDAEGEREAEVQRHCKATLRCYPDDEQHTLAEGALCFQSGLPATHIALFARAY